MPCKNRRNASCRLNSDMLFVQTASSRAGNNSALCVLYRHYPRKLWCPGSIERKGVCLNSGICNIHPLIPPEDITGDSCPTPSPVANGCPLSSSFLPFCQFPHTRAGIFKRGPAQCVDRFYVPSPLLSRTSDAQPAAPSTLPDMAPVAEHILSETPCVCTKSQFQRHSDRESRPTYTVQTVVLHLDRPWPNRVTDCYSMFVCMIN